MSKFYSLSYLAQHLGAELVGDADFVIYGISNLSHAQASQISFLSSSTYLKYLAESQAGALILSPELAGHFSGNKLIVSNPYLAYAQLTKLFARITGEGQGIHPSAVIAEDAVLGEGVSIGPNAVIGARAVIGDHCILGPCSVVGEDCVIGARSQLAANVSIYHDVKVGTDCIFHSGAVIGADGFGFARTREKSWVKIYQLGSVIIGNHVEVGANSTIDRGALDDTIIGNGVKIDNIVHTGHNCRYGDNVAIAAMTGVSGSTHIGENTTISGAVGIVGHIDIAPDVHITGMSMVSASISEAGSYSSGTPLAPTREWRRNAVRFRQLDSLASRIKQLEACLKQHDLFNLSN